MTTTVSEQMHPTASPGPIDRCNQLFLEADQLSTQAYALLSDQPVSTQTLQRFTEMKKIAEDKYRQARQERSRNKDRISQ